ncbi:hypothetical protein PIROE2DRAFT_9719, partial [Piromyces sp. E2]
STNNNNSVPSFGFSSSNNTSLFSTRSNEIPEYSSASIFTNASTTTSGFSFSKPATDINTTTSGFSFGKPATDTTTTTSVFSFGKPATDTTTTTSVFGFGKPATDTNKTTSVFGFGKPATDTTTTTSVFGFGKPATDTNKTTSGFGFGKPATDTNTTTSVFGFGKPATDTNTTTSVFGFGKPATDTNTTTSVFGFGKPATNTTTTTSGFSFSKPATDINTTTSVFGFGKPATDTNTTTSGFSFGKPTTNTATATSAFGFGNQTASNNASFGFGGSSFNKKSYTNSSIMASFLNRHGGCFNGDAIVLLNNGQTKRVKDLKKGDCLKNHSIVQCVIEQNCFSNCINGNNNRNNLGKPYMCDIHGVLFTPYHPILINGTWYFPIDLIDAQPVSVGSWFNLILEDKVNQKYEVEFLNGVKAITLGHYRNENKILSHPYFGTDLVLKDLKERDPIGYSKGYIHIKEFNPRQLQYDDHHNYINYYKKTFSESENNNYYIKDGYDIASPLS